MIFAGRMPGDDSFQSMFPLRLRFFAVNTPCAGNPVCLKNFCFDRHDATT
jgi:hypothetical protein